MTVSAGGVPLESERCWRLGLIVNELVANAARYGCFSRQQGGVKIELNV